MKDFTLKLFVSFCTMPNVDMIPKGPAYAGLMHQHSLDEFTYALALLEKTGLITQTAEVVKLTDKAKKMVPEIKAMYNEELSKMAACN